MKNIVKIIIDPGVPQGEYHVGGVQVLKAPTDEELGRGLRTKVVRVSDRGAAEALYAALSVSSDFEVEPEITFAELV